MNVLYTENKRVDHFVLKPYMRYCCLLASSWRFLAPHCMSQVGTRGADTKYRLIAEECQLFVNQLEPARVAGHVGFRGLLAQVLHLHLHLHLQLSFVQVVGGSQVAGVDGAEPAATARCTSSPGVVPGDILLFEGFAYLNGNSLRILTLCTLHSAHRCTTLLQVPKQCTTA